MNEKFESIDADASPSSRSAAAPSISERLARGLTDFTGSTLAFLVAAAFILGWAATGPLFGYSENWQLVVNTATTIITFLMVFLIQRAQNKDSLAIHLKLDELVAALRGASNRLVSAEDLPEDDLAALRDRYRKLLRDAAGDQDQHRARSIDDGVIRHESRKPGRVRRKRRGA